MCCEVSDDTNGAIKTGLDEEQNIQDHRIPDQMDDVCVISSEMNQQNYFYFGFFSVVNIPTMICVSVS